MTIKPGGDETAVNVFNSEEDNRYLDWQFDTFEIDIDATNNKLDFKESGGELTATLTSATYTLSALAAEIKTQMDAAGALVYTVTVSKDDKVTISSTEGFSLLPTEGSNSKVSILPIIGFEPKPGFGDSDFSVKSPQEGERVRALPRAITIEIGDGNTTGSVTEYIDLMSVDGDQLFSSRS